MTALCLLDGVTLTAALHTKPARLPLATRRSGLTISTSALDTRDATLGCGKACFAHTAIAQGRITSEAQVPNNHPEKKNPQIF